MSDRVRRACGLGPGPAKSGPIPTFPAYSRVDSHLLPTIYVRRNASWTRWNRDDIHLKGEASRFRWLRAPATMNDEGLADVAAANPFRLPRLYPGIGCGVDTTIRHGDKPRHRMAWRRIPCSGPRAHRLRAVHSAGEARLLRAAAKARVRHAVRHFSLRSFLLARTARASWPESRNACHSTEASGEVCTGTRSHWYVSGTRAVTVARL
jgi:hypothetical protein